MTPDRNLPIACTLEVGDLAARRREWEALDAAVVDRASVTGGFEVRFRNDDGIATRLERLVDAERACCGFADWQVGSARDAVVLRVTSSDDGVAALRAAFGIPDQRDGGNP